MSMAHLDTKFQHQANLDSKALAFWSALKVVVDEVNTEAETLPLLSRVQFLRMTKNKVQVQYYIPHNGQDYWSVANATFTYQHDDRSWVAATRPTDLLDAVMHRLEWTYQMDGFVGVVCESANQWYKTQAAEIDNNRKAVPF